MQRHLSWALSWFADAGADVTLVTTAGGALAPDSGARSIEIPGTRPGRYSEAWWSGTRRFIRDRPLSAWDAIVSEDGGAWGVVEELRRGDVVDLAMFHSILCEVEPAAKELITFGDRQIGIAYDLDDSALQRDLGPIRRTPLEDGIRQTLEMFQQLRAEGRTA